MSPIVEILFSLAITTIGVILGYRAGIKKGFEHGANYAESINNEWMKRIKLPTSDEIMAGTNRRFWDNEAIKQVFKS